MGVFWVYFLSETAQVELKSGRVSVPAAHATSGTAEPASTALFMTASQSTADPGAAPGGAGGSAAAAAAGHSGFTAGSAGNSFM